MTLAIVQLTRYVRLACYMQSYLSTVWIVEVVQKSILSAQCPVESSNKQTLMT